MLPIICMQASAQLTVSTTKIGNSTTLVMWSGYQNGQPTVGSMTVFEWGLIWPNIGQMSMPDMRIRPAAPEPPKPESRIRFFYVSEPLILQPQKPAIYDKQ